MPACSADGYWRDRGSDEEGIEGGKEQGEKERRICEGRNHS